MVKAELNSLHGVTMDSTKLLTEKLTLARELSSLRPEVEHLRSQVASHQALLAEKLSLQRQLNAVQVDLETEKRSTQRILAREDKAHGEDRKLESRMETLQTELTKERRDRQRVERDAQKASTESENRKNTLESRLDAFRNKLKTTKEHLKETQMALESAQAVSIAPPARGKGTGNSDASVARNPRKRQAVQMDADTMIGTPGDLPVSKKNKKGSTLVGEKSTFSITPFLNRTASLAPESPSSPGARNDNEEVQRSDSHLLTESKLDDQLREAVLGIGSLNSAKSTVQPMKPQVLENSKASKTNSRAPLGRKTKASSLLEQVAEEDYAENGHDAGKGTIVAKGTSGLDNTIHEGGEMRKKNRKLLGMGMGRTLFDEGEGDEARGGGGLLGDARGLASFSRGGLGGPKLGSRRALSTSIGSFGAISPLKKDKR